MTSKTKNIQTAPFFSVAFRPFFLSGALFSVIAVLLWVGALHSSFEFDPYGGSFWWHAHEMLFGFVLAIVVGFLLTAVQNWTGMTSLKGSSLLAFWMLWLISRITLAIDLGLPTWLVAFIDLIFLPIAGFVLARLIIKAKRWQNLIFIPVLMLMTIANVLMHWGAYTGESELISQGSYAMVMLVMMLITVLGGRVFPMFTANGTGTRRVESIQILELLTIVSTALIAVIYTTGLLLPDALQASLLLFAAICHLIRVVRWRFWVTLKTPLVWSLHVGYFSIPLGYALMAYHYLSGQVLLSTVLHGLTVGAIGITILAMMTRVSLGHTGRKLIVGKLLTIAFIAIVLSFVVRIFYPYVSDDYLLSMSVTAALWGLAYGVYVVDFFPKLIAERL